MIKEIKRTAQFKKDYKKAVKSGCSEEAFREVLGYLVGQIPLPAKYGFKKTGVYEGYDEYYLRNLQKYLFSV